MTDPVYGDRSGPVERTSTSRPGAILLPALSSIATRAEMRPLAERLNGRLRCTLLDWPGFGAPVTDERPLAPALLDAFLSDLPERRDVQPRLAIAAGHGATYLARCAARHPELFDRLVLIAPTWRGPLPTMMGGRRPGLCRTVRATLEAPGIGSALFRLNMSAPVLGWMMREHVYADAARVTPALVAEKAALTRRPGARHATAAFVSGGLDPFTGREAFLALFEGRMPPTLVIRPRQGPRRSTAEIDALIATGRVEAVTVDGALAPHEENPEAVADAVLAFVGSD